MQTIGQLIFLIVLFDCIMASFFVSFKSPPQVTSNPGSATDAEGLLLLVVELRVGVAAGAAHRGGWDREGRGRGVDGVRERDRVS